MGEISNSQKITAWLCEFDAALQQEEEDLDKVMELFAAPECFWRDFVAFSWNIQTFELRDEIVPMLKENLARVKPRGFEINGPTFEKPMMIGAGIKFETSVGWGRGFLWLRGSKCWTIMTSMWELKGHEEGIARFRPFGATPGSARDRKTWAQEQEQERKELGHSKQPYCLIVGGGHSGVMLGARLKMLGVPTLIVERHARLGDNWRNRYKSLALHTPFFTDYFPYAPYPSNWPVLPSKDKVGDWIESYTKLMDLNYWCSTECKASSFNEDEGHWEVTVQTKKSLVSGVDEVTQLVLRPTHLVLACGMTGNPKIPSFKGQESFEGTQFHSSQYQQGEDWKGKKAVVIGACTSAHDICLDLWEQGASEITMVQKSPSIILTMKSFIDTLLDPDLQGKEFDHDFDMDSYDIKGASLPFKVMPRVLVPVYNRIAEEEAELHSKLRKMGFDLHMGEDGSGLLMAIVRRAGGYYIDVGASELIADGIVKVKNGLKEIKPKSVVYSDDSEVSADLIIFATGYGNMNDYVETIVSKEAAEKVGLCWGLGSNTNKDPGPWEGELKNLWKPLPVPNLWMTSAGFSQSRFHSRHLALQLKARMEGIPTPVFGKSLPKSVK